jgi:hypothetical protein
MTDLCPHGCAGWCAACDFAAAHPDGDPLPARPVHPPGRVNVGCPVKGCNHAMALHRDGVCEKDDCRCGLPASSLRRVATAVADELEDPEGDREHSLPQLSRVLRRAAALEGRW